MAIANYFNVSQTMLLVSVCPPTVVLTTEYHWIKSCGHCTLFLLSDVDLVIGLKVLLAYLKTITVKSEGHRFDSKTYTFVVQYDDNRLTLFTALVLCLSIQADCPFKFTGWIELWISCVIQENLNLIIISMNVYIMWLTQLI